MFDKLFVNVIRAIPIVLILYLSASIAGLDTSKFSLVLYSIVALSVGVVYGILLVYKTPSPEFMQMIIEEEKDLKREGE